MGRGVGQKVGPKRGGVLLASSKHPHGVQTNAAGSRQPGELIAKCFSLSFFLFFGPQNVELNGFLLKSSCPSMPGAAAGAESGGKQPLIGS